jgi:hypothetical protein
MSGSSILVQKKVPALMRSVAAEELYQPIKSLSKEEQHHLVDQCLEYNYKVYSISIISTGKIRNFLEVRDHTSEDFDRSPLYWITSRFQNS